MRIGPEPTTDRFVAVMGGMEDKCTPGNAAAMRADMPFSALQGFGSALLSKFEVHSLRRVCAFSFRVGA
jgi:hypothetical protein